MGCCGVEQFLSSGGGGGGPFSNDLLPTADATYDLGSTAFRWDNLFLSGDIGSSLFPINELYWGDGTRLGHLFTSVPNNSVIVSAESNHGLEFRTNNITRWTIDTAGDLVATVDGSEAIIKTNTVDGADNKRLALTAGGDADASRSGYIYLYGNENNSGIVEISAGSVSGSKVQLIASNGNANARIEFNLNVSAWRIDEALNRDLIAVGSGATRRVRSDSNTSLIEVRGGSGTDNTTGGALSTYGNSHGTFPGRTLLETGAVAAAPLILQTSSTGSILFNTNLTTKRTLDSAGLDTFKSHAAYTGSGTFEQTHVVNTTDATTTTLASITLADNTMYKFHVEVCGRFNSTTAKGAWAELRFGAYRNNAGVATLSGTGVNEGDTHGASGYTIAFDVDGANAVRIRVTGAGGETVSWIGDVKYTAVSTAA